MEVVSLIYTKKVKPKAIASFLESKSDFFSLKKKKGDIFFLNTSDESTVRINTFSIDIMYKNIHTEKIALLIRDLSKFNNDKKITLKIYNEKEKDSIKRFLETSNYYLI